MGSTLQYYWFNTARINSDADITKISAINFVVDSNLVAASGQPDGWFDIESGGLKVQYPDIGPTAPPGHIDAVAAHATGRHAGGWGGPEFPRGPIFVEPFSGILSSYNGNQLGRSKHPVR